MASTLFMEPNGETLRRVNSITGGCLLARGPSYIADLSMLQDQQQQQREDL